ncbi:MAG: repeat protein [Phycisphaerales bacterium]|nr:repeat protein [Phycisphaerales bacterium]
MTSNRRNGLLLAAVMAALPVLGLGRQAAAQYPAGQDGHANDANNRAGSGGYNGPGSTGSAVTPDNIVTRNVTGGAGFRGPIRETDPGAFRARMPGAGLDNFIRNSAGAPTGAGGPSDLTVPRPYYGEARGVAPPPGSLPVGFTGGYVGTVPLSPLSFSSSLNTPATGATSLQARTLATDTLLLNSVYNTSGYQGLSDAALYGNLPTPLPGLRNAQAGDLTQSPFALPELPSNYGGAENPAILRMRAELEQSALPSGLTPGVPEAGAPATGNNQPGGPNTPSRQPGAQQNQNGQNQNGAQNQNGQPNQPGAQDGGPNQPLNQPLVAPLESPAGAALVNAPTGAAVNAGPLGASPLTQQSYRQQSTNLVPAARQSQVLDELQRRLQRYNAAGSGTTDAEANRQFREMQQRNAGGANPRQTNPGPNGAAQPAPEAGPLKVSSLATGVKAKGLHDLLVGAEDLMRQGKFDSAIDQYVQAQRVAPNNPLTYLGRAHAELGAGYYTKAEQDLRQVFHADTELLLAQFDLSAAMGAERLAFLRKDLTGLTQTDPKSETPWFLLAYLDYNAGDAAAAEKDLNEAEKRSNRGDWAIRLLRTHWTLPSKPKAAIPPGNPAAPQPTPPAAAPTVPPATQTPPRDLNK